jgi:hypothetical protein
MVARLAGTASYTTGPATRRALAEVGALGATTGNVVHLAQRPSTDPASMSVLAHELTHARNPVMRPRFLLHNHSGSMDADERSARSVGDQVTRSGATVRRMLGDGPNVLSGLGSQVADQATSTVSQVSSAASGIGDRVADQASAISAGIVDSLRVGGASGANVVDVARTAVEQTVRETATTAVREATEAGGDLDASARNMLAQLDNLVGNASATAAQTAGGVARDVQAAGTTAAGAVSQAAGAVAQGVAGAAGAAASGLSTASGMAKADLDRIAEALEERILREIERRGGRYAGVF